jgi:uncharacterized repeat protein (TIGR01451 family)
VTVNVAASATTPQVNAVAVSGGGSASANATDSTTILVPVLSITKTHTGNFAQGQQGATYTVTVQNTGAAPTNATTVTVTEAVPSGLTLVSMSGSGWTCANPSCTRTDVLPSATSPQANAVSVSGGGSVNANTTDSTTIITSLLSITKSTASTSFTQGQLGATYTVTVHNAAGAGPTNGTTVTVTDTLPGGLTATGISGTGWVCVLTSLTCTRSDVLQPNSSYPIITVTVNVGLSAPSPQVNQVSVSGGGSPTANGSASTPVLVPVLSITKSHSGNFAQGQNGATYTVTVSNTTGTGPTNGTLVTVTDTVPSGLTLVSMVGTGWTCPTNACTRTDVVAVGASYPQITVTVNVASNAPTPQLNKVSVSGGGSATANGQDSTIIIQPVLSISKTHTGNFTQGQTGATYTVTVTNNGLASTSGKVTVTETVPSGLTLTGMTGTGWTCPGTAGANTCDRSDVLANGSSYPTITVTVNVGASATSPQVNAVAVSGGGSANGNTTDSTTITGGSSSCPTGGNLGALNGQYAFQMSGFDASGPMALSGIFNADGTGHIATTVGVEDINSNSVSGVQTNVAITSGTYTVGTDNRGCLVITTAAGTSTFRFALGTFVSNVATKGRLIEFDSTGGTGSGVLRKQDPNAFFLTQINGNYAFGAMSPQLGSGRFAIAGVVSLNGGGVVTTGAFDTDQSTLVAGSMQGNVDNTGTTTYPTNPLSLTGTYTVGTNGRGTLTLSPGGPAVHASTYIISATELLIMSTDPQGTNSLFTGSALRQSGTLTMNATSVVQITGSSYNGTNATANVQIGVFKLSGSTITFSSDQNQAGTTTSNNGSGTITVNASTGRVTLAGAGSHPPVFYLVTANEGFFLGTSNSAETGFFEPQTATSLTGTPKTFVLGTVAPATAAVSDKSGFATFADATNVTATVDKTSGSTLTGGQTNPTTYSSFDANGRATITPGTPPGAVLYMISPTKAVLIDAQSSDPSIQVVEQ